MAIKHIGVSLYCIYPAHKQTQANTGSPSFTQVHAHKRRNRLAIGHTKALTILLERIHTRHEDVKTDK